MKYLAVVLGISLVMTLQTSLRFFNGIGIGEIGLVLSSSLTILMRVLINPSWKMQGASGYVFSYWAFLVLVLTPITTFSFLNALPGSSLRDLAAFVFSGMVILAVIANQKHLVVTCKSILVALPLIILLSYFFGGVSSWYDSVRFTAGAKNPNQFALYLIVAHLLAAMVVERRFVLWGLHVFLLYFGLRSGSDAYLLSFAATVGVGSVLYVFRYRHLGTLLPMLLFVVAAVLLLALGLFLPMILEEWAQADEGGGRLTLFKNGLNAWIHSPLSILVGNGAGSFSGVFGPFEAEEAHSTILDVLTIGGPILLWIVYRPFLLLIWQSYTQNRPFVAGFAFAILVFLLFHFVGRQPIFWFAAISASITYYQRKVV